MLGLASVFSAIRLIFLLFSSFIRIRWPTIIDVEETGLVPKAMTWGLFFFLGNHYQPEATGGDKKV
ncbi:hypothetical protein, partial [Proteus mirabilis]|uniref:hypothetical protein n=1 Tax=Proteus mirabilis TaxID=584 RepID=UPI001C12E50E